jgi:hypothetical protein
MAGVLRKPRSRIFVKKIAVFEIAACIASRIVFIKFIEFDEARSVL